MKVKFLTPVQHDAHSYQVGDSADLPNGAAKALIDCGAAEAADPAAVKAKAKAEAEAEAKAKADAKAEAEAKALEAWDKDADLRAQYGDDFGAYLASFTDAG